MHNRLLLASTLALSIGFAGCDSTTSTPTPAPSSQGPASPKLASASSTAATAYQTMFDQSSMDAANPLGSNTASLASANATLEQAYAENPNDSRTAFALAITDLSLTLNDLAGTFDRAQQNGLSIGGGSSVTATTPQGVASELPALARAVSDPSKAPLVSELQDSLEMILMPTLDKSIDLLGKAWADPAFEFHVAIDPENFPEDTLIIDRSDVGFALSILQAIRAETRWMLSYNFDFDMAGSYAWMDTLGNFDPEEAPISAEQDVALNKLKALVAPSSSFLKVRATKEALLASVPGELKAALQRSREAALLAYTLKADAEDHIPTITTIETRDAFTKVVDSALRWFSGPVRVNLYSKISCTDTSWSVYNGTVNPGYSYVWERTELLGMGDAGCGDGGYDYVSGSYESHSLTITGSTVSQPVVMDLSKLLTLRDLKVFMPRYQWNATADWKADGPFSLIGTDNQPITTSAMDSLSGFDAVKPHLSWADPTFGGVFPELVTSGDVVELFRKAIDEGAPATVAARGPLALF